MKKLEITIKKDEISKIFKFDVDAKGLKIKNKEFKDVAKIYGYDIFEKIMGKYSNSIDKKNKYEVILINRKELKKLLITKKLTLSNEAITLNDEELFRLSTDELYFDNNKFVLVDYFAL